MCLLLKVRSTRAGLFLFCFVLVFVSVSLRYPQHLEQCLAPTKCSVKEGVMVNFMYHIGYHGGTQFLVKQQSRCCHGVFLKM